MQGHLPLCRPRLAVEEMAPADPLLSRLKTRGYRPLVPVAIRSSRAELGPPLRASDPPAAPSFAAAASLPLLLPDCGPSGPGQTPWAESEAGGRGHRSRAPVRSSAEGVSPAGHSEDTGRGNSWGGSEGWWERGRQREAGPWVRGIARCSGLTFQGPREDAGEAGSASARPDPPPASAPTVPAPCAPNPAACPGSSLPRPVTAGRPAAVLSRPRRCRERSSRPWRAQAPWTLRAATRSCARCATRSTSAPAC